MNDTTTAPATKSVEINLNQLEIGQQIDKAALPQSTKQMARRILALCVQKNSGRLWFNMVALRSLRRSLGYGSVARLGGGAPHRPVGSASLGSIS